MEKLAYIDENLMPVFEPGLLQKVANAITKKYAAYLDEEVFELEINYNAERVQLKYVLKKIDNSVVYPIECVYLRDPESKEKAEESAAIMLDYMEAYWTEYLTDERQVFLPLNWSKHSHNDREFFLRGFIRNLDLEAQADALFAEHGVGDYLIEPISLET